MLLNIPENIVIADYEGNPTAFLNPQADGVKDAKVDARQNKESTLEFYLPPACEKLQEITPECRIYPGNNKEYTILKDEAIDLVRSEDGKLWAKVMAEESFTCLNYEYSRVRNDSEDLVNAHTVVIVAGGSDLSGGLYAVGTAGHALYGLLANVDWGGKPPWTVGTVDVTGIHDLETEKMHVLDNINKVQELWGGIIVWDSINHTVSLRDESTWQNFTGFNIRYGKNLKEITRTQSNKIITRLYVYGMDDLNIADVNDGKEYLEDYTYVPRRYTAIVQNPDIYDQDQLKVWGQKELDKVCRPRFSYSVKIVDLQTLEKYCHETFAMGDMADVYDPDISVTQRLRITRHAYYIFQPWKCEIELGDPVLCLEDIIAGTNAATSYVSSNVASNGKLSGLEDLLTVNGLQILLDSGTIITWQALPDGVMDESNFTTFANTWISTRKVLLSELTSLNEQNPIIYLFSCEGTAQGGTNDTITLSSTASASDDTYNDMTIKIISGTGSGQERVISDYVGSTRVVTVDDSWDTIPNGTSIYSIKGSSLDMTYQNELGIGDSLREKLNKYRYIKQSRNETTFFFKDSNYEDPESPERPNVRYDGFYIGNTKLNPNGSGGGGLVYITFVD